MEEKIAHFYHKKSVLVTGGCGFIGSFLVKKLVSLGAYVTILDNLSTGSLASIADVRDNVCFVQGSINDYMLCCQLMKDQTIVFHLAACTVVSESIRSPHSCYITNVTGTEHILEAARHAQVDQIIFSSSAAVYGNCSDFCNENQKPEPVSSYGYSKLMGELLCEQYRTVYNQNSVCLRYFNVYDKARAFSGAKKGVYEHFRACYDTNIPITIFGDGMQQRDFVSVDAVVNANLIGGYKNKELSFTTINVATGTSVTLHELAILLKKEYPNYHEPILYKPVQEGDIPISRANCSRYNVLLAV